MNSGVTLESHRKKLLSGWLDVWRGLLEVFPVRALDLANHKGEKVSTGPSFFAPSVFSHSSTNCFEIFCCVVQETGNSNVARAFRVSSHVLLRRGM